MPSCSSSVWSSSSRSSFENTNFVWALELKISSSLPLRIFSQGLYMYNLYSFIIIVQKKCNSNNNSFITWACYPHTSHKLFLKSFNNSRCWAWFFFRSKENSPSVPQLKHGVFSLVFTIVSVVVCHKFSPKKISTIPQGGNQELLPKLGKWLASRASAGTTTSMHKVIVSHNCLLFQRDNPNVVSPWIIDPNIEPFL